jgi:hypothetical protein
MLPEYLVDLSHGEFVKFNNRGLGTVSGGQDIACLFFAVCFNGYSCLVHSVPTAPVSFCRKMGTVIQKTFNNLGTGQQFFLMRDLYKKFRHNIPPLH